MPPESTSRHQFRTYTATFEVETHGFCDVVDITPALQQVVEDSQVGTGIVCVANPGSTAGITTLEFEPGAVQDLKEALERLAPCGRRYHHDDTWQDGNGFAHLRSALIGTARSFPIRDGAPVLGTWQQVVFVDFDNRERHRRLVVTVVGV
ncbi:YjbQ family protein [candidate division WOR-3 bacterium]|nr:YjbQ family protein [candidate division WOR-3 bacterium]